MQPILGRRGSCSRSETTSRPPSTSKRSHTVFGNSRPSGPNERMKTSQARSMLMERISTRSVSPGRAPLTASGPVTWLKRSNPISSTRMPRASISYGSSLVSNSTTAPVSTRSAGSAVASSAAYREDRGIRYGLTDTAPAPSPVVIVLCNHTVHFRERVGGSSPGWHVRPSSSALLGTSITENRRSSRHSLGSIPTGSARKRNGR